MIPFRNLANKAAASTVHPEPRPAFLQAHVNVPRKPAPGRPLCLSPPSTAAATASVWFRRAARSAPQRSPPTSAISHPPAAPAAPPAAPGPAPTAAGPACPRHTPCSTGAGAVGAHGSERRDESMRLVIPGPNRMPGRTRLFKAIPMPSTQCSAAIPLNSPPGEGGGQGVLEVVEAGQRVHKVVHHLKQGEEGPCTLCSEQGTPL